MLRKDWIGTSRACGLLKQPDNQKLPTFHAIIVRGDDLPRTAAFQPGVGPDLAHLCAWLGLVFAESMFAAIDNADTVSEEMHFGLVETAIMRGACAFLV